MALGKVPLGLSVPYLLVLCSDSKGRSVIGGSTEGQWRCISGGSFDKVFLLLMGESFESSHPHLLQEPQLY